MQTSSKVCIFCSDKLKGRFIGLITWYDIFTNKKGGKHNGCIDHNWYRILYSSSRDLRLGKQVQVRRNQYGILDRVLCAYDRPSGNYARQDEGKEVTKQRRIYYEISDWFCI